MKKLIVAAALLAGVGITAPVMAAPIVTVTGPSGTFGNDNVVCPNNGITCTFSDTINFTTPTGYNLQSGTISTIMTDSNMDTNINFQTVTLNGISFNLSPTGAYESGFILNQPVPTNGLNTLIISGTVGGLGGSNPNTPANASYSGTLSFAAATAVPEPAAWSMMILGMGLVGFALRRRVQSSEVKFDAKIKRISEGALA